MKLIGAEFGVTATDDRTAMCGAGFVDLPQVPADVNVVLDAAVQRRKSDGTVIESKTIALGQVPGRHLVTETDKHRKHLRVYLRDKTVYFVNCGGPFDRAATDGPIATRVMDSFKLL